MAIPTIQGFSAVTRLRSGGFATVYRAVDQSTRRLVAIKVLDRIEAGEDKRFENELVSYTRLAGHRNILQVLGNGRTSEDQPYLVLEFMAGGSLEDVVAVDALTASDTAWVGDQVLAALEHAHREGIWHRDVKPANILLGNGDLRVADFGLAKFANVTKTTASAVVSTLAYAAPEVLLGRGASARSDVYSLGATLYRLASGRPLYSQVPDAFAAAAGLKAPDLSGIPPELMGTIAHFLAADPKARPQSATEARAELAPAVPLEPSVRLAERIRQVASSLDTVSYHPNSGSGEPTYVGASGSGMSNTLPPINGNKSHPRKAGKYLPVAVGLIVLTLLSILIFNVLGSSPEVPPVARLVPDSLVGMKYADAKTTLDAANIGHTVSDKAVPKGDKRNGKVIAVAPESGTALSAGQKVQLTVATTKPGGETTPAGETKRLVPEGLVGLKRSAAESRLDEEEIGYKVVSKVVSADDDRAGTIVDVDPEGGIELSSGQKVTLTVAIPPDTPEKRVVPASLVGLKLAAAKVKLDAANVGYTVESEEVPSGDDREGTVLVVDPKSGTELSPDQKVVLTVATAPSVDNPPQITDPRFVSVDSGLRTRRICVGDQIQMAAEAADLGGTSEFVAIFSWFRGQTHTGGSGPTTMRLESGSTYHSATIDILEDGNYTFIMRATDASGNTTTARTTVPMAPGVKCGTALKFTVSSEVK